MKVASNALITLFLMAPGTLHASIEATVLHAHGEVWLVDQASGSSRPAEPGVHVFLEGLVFTGASAHVELRLPGQSLVSLHERSAIRIADASGSVSVPHGRVRFETDSHPTSVFELAAVLEGETIVPRAPADFEVDAQSERLIVFHGEVDVVQGVESRHVEEGEALVLGTSSLPYDRREFLDAAERGPEDLGSYRRPTLLTLEAASYDPDGAYDEWSSLQGDDWGTPWGDPWTDEYWYTASPGLWWWGDPWPYGYAGYGGLGYGYGGLGWGWYDPYGYGWGWYDTHGYGCLWGRGDHHHHHDDDASHDAEARRVRPDNGPGRTATSSRIDRETRSRYERPRLQLYRDRSSSRRSPRSTVRASRSPGVHASPQPRSSSDYVRPSPRPRPSSGYVRPSPRSRPPTRIGPRRARSRGSLGRPPRTAPLRRMSTPQRGGRNVIPARGGASHAPGRRH